jgi:DNA-directed RNA polymerase subunit beta
VKIEGDTGEDLRRDDDDDLIRAAEELGIDLSGGLGVGRAELEEGEGAAVADGEAVPVPDDAGEADGAAE